ncbi:TonB-dependent receptor [Novosphingobium taihuense]|uniref:Iron complex outermembrane receptor protein n=1 Tax=Novosphingobium taihuense TaxID=260085 RepID=A0A7W7ACZ2_9SPHN|nr:TonB-dependent receptor [Novosphingobium taihuense]MBB4614758.1 iron complex outermembrane receptor protein [Novosphingobium taihuense]TWH78862.1 iron complex outermembrane receptor protein [Novosphingobium taihuense]
MKKVLRSTLLAATLLAGIQASPVSAQEAQGDQADDQTGRGIQDIVVTARRVSESLQSTPVAVTAVDGNALTNNQVRTVDQLQAIAPGLVVQPATAQPGSASFSLRGQSSPDGLIAIDQSVGAYVDGVYVARSSGGLFNFLDVERVEVLRGPQGTLFGRNTTGGAINVVNRKPTDKFEGMVSAGIGNYEARDLSAVINVPIAAGLAARVAYSHNEHEGYGVNVPFNQRVGGDNTEFVRGTIAFDDGGAFRAALQADYTDRRTGGELVGLKSFTPTALNGLLVGLCSGPTALAACPVKGPAGDTLANYAWEGNVRGTGGFWRVFNSMPGIYGDAETWGASGTFEYDFSEAFNVKSITAWRGIDTGSLSDNDGTPYLFTGGLVRADGNFIHQRQFSQELQFSGSLLDGNLDYILGAFYFVENGTDRSKSYALFPLSPSLGYVDATVRNESQAGFGQLTYSITPTLRFTGGLRYTKDIRSIVRRNRAETPGGSGNFTCSMDATTLDTPGVCASTNRRTYDYWSYTAGLDWQASDDIFLYIKTSKANRAGGFNTRAITGGSSVTFDPETVTDYEIGGKFDFLDRTVRLNLAAFYSDYRNIQRNVPVVAPNGTLTSGNQNIARGHIKGFEAELVVAPTQGLRLSGALTLLDPEYTSFNIPVTRNGAIVSVDVRDTPYTYTPKTSFTLAADYEVPVGPGKLALHTDYSYRSETFGVGPLIGQGLFGDTNRTSNRIPSFGVLNARIAYRLDEPDLEVALFARNLGQTRYYQRILALEDTPLGTSSYLPGNPRTYGVSLTYKFGGY